MRRWVGMLVCFAGCQCQPPQPGTDAGTEPGLLEFRLESIGAVLRGEVVERTGRFTNTRAAPAQVSGLTVTGAHFTLVGDTALDVPAGGEATTRVRYAPTSLGPHAGALTWESTVTAGTQAWPLSGTGIGPALELTPDRLDLGTLALYAGVPTIASASLSAHNVGLDSTPPRPEAGLQLFIDVLSTSEASPDELCVGGCTGAPLRLDPRERAMIPVAFASVSPGLKTWDVRVFSNDPAAPIRTVPVQVEVIARPTCQFALPPLLAFGSLTSPESRELEVLFENVGTEVCEVSRVDLGAQSSPQPTPVFSVVNAPAGTQTIAPGGVLRVAVRAAAQGAVPQVPGAALGELRFELNSPAGFARVPLTAALEWTCLSVSPSPLDFGTVKTGCRSAARQVRLGNRCTHALTVTSATVPGLSAFSVSAALPRSLMPSEALSLAVRYAPGTTGPERAVINLAWLDATAVKHTTVPMLGDANATGQNTDRFPPVSNKLDLLLALDDSCSMADKAAKVSAQLPALLTALQARQVDFHLGVVTAAYPGPPWVGDLRPASTGVRWLTPSTPDLQARFAELTAYTGGENLESCEEAALAALTAPKVSDPLINGGFLRADAALSVLCVSDFTDTATRLEDLLQVKASGRFRWDSIGAVGPSTPQCAVFWTPGGPPLAQATGGETLDVCANDWAPLLSTIAASASAARTFFPLRSRPDPMGTPPLGVEVSGQPVSPTTDGGTPAWTWDSTPNAVRFTPPFAPGPADLVSISYPVACTP